MCDMPIQPTVVFGMHIRANKKDEIFLVPFIYNLICSANICPNLTVLSAS